MTITSDALLDACTAVADLVGDLPEVDPATPTPCEGFVFSQLTTHLIGTTSAFATAGITGALDPDDPWESRIVAPSDWRAGLVDNLRRTATGWSDPDRWEGRIEHCAMPARSVGEMALIEVVVHGWDLARAAGREWSVPAPLAAEVRRQVTATAELGRRMAVYGPAVPVGADAGDFEQALALTGRDPRWSTGPR